MQYIYHENCFQSTTFGTKDDDNQTVILCSTIPSLCILFTVIILVILWKKGIICHEKPNNQNVITHKNDLYGNLTNQEYFDQRYDTNILDTNQYYEGKGEQYGEYIA